MLKLFGLTFCSVAFLKAITDGVICLERFHDSGSDTLKVHRRDAFEVPEKMYERMWKWDRQEALINLCTACECVQWLSALLNVDNQRIGLGRGTSFRHLLAWVAWKENLCINLHSTKLMPMVAVDVIVDHMINYLVAANKCA